MDSNSLDTAPIKDVPFHTDILDDGWLDTAFVENVPYRVDMILESLDGLVEELVDGVGLNAAFGPSFYDRCCEPPPATTSSTRASRRSSRRRSCDFPLEEAPPGEALRCSRYAVLMESYYEHIKTGKWQPMGDFTDALINPDFDNFLKAFYPEDAETLVIDWDAIPSDDESGEQLDDPNVHWLETMMGAFGRFGDADYFPDYEYLPDDD